MKSVRFTWEFLIKFQRFILITSGLVIVFGLIMSILFRYVLKLDFFGLEEIILIPTIWLYFIGAAYGSYEDSHISGDLAGAIIKSKRIKFWLRIITLVLSLVATVIFTIWTLNFLIWSIYNSGVTTGWGIPIFVYHLPIFISFVLISLYTLYHLGKHIVLHVGSKEGE
ncbi:TRAP transporter small permease [Oceanobacillus luteolus]|uniref:TRAP transporter small permease n=1 Tax=Oceanobacillus luteolus TaxID=1274358 RepID=A0ABW4HPE6_9BACI